jgi:GntR family transcriptional regulator
VILSVDPDDPTPVYQQIRGQIQRMVASGTLTAGTRLPTIRQLATDLGLAKGTVAKAYEALLHDGIVTAAGRHGTVIAPHRPTDPATRTAELHAAARDYAIAVHQLDIDPDTAVAALVDAMDDLEALRPDERERAQQPRR